VPSVDDALVFPSSGQHSAMTNDLPPGFKVGPMYVRGGYAIYGNALTLDGDVSLLTVTSVSFACFVDLKLGTSVHLSGQIFGAVDVNGQTLILDTFYAIAELRGPVNGSGSIVIDGYGASVYGGGNFNGTINGGLSLYGTLPNAAVISDTFLSRLSGAGTLGTVVIGPSGNISPGRWDPSLGNDPANFGVLITRSLAISGSYYVDLVPGGGDQLQVNGTVTLGGRLAPWVPGGAPTMGQTFIIIDNDGIDAVSGVFRGLPERATVSANLYRFRITYRGGDGNDVALEAVGETTTNFSQSSTATKYGEAVTLAANITSAYGTPTGAVMFTADGVGIGTVPVLNGVATLTTSILEPGTRSLSASFLGTGGFGDSASSAASHAVARIGTTCSITSNHAQSLYGEKVVFTVTVSVQPPSSGQPSGQVTVFADGVSIGTAAVFNGTAAVQTAAFHAGSRLITAEYSGDAHFEVSSASPIQQTVGKASAIIEARIRNPLLIGLSSRMLVLVSANNSSLYPSGTVSVTEGASLLVEQALGDGLAQLPLPAFSPGVHKLLVQYGGDLDFEPVSTTATQVVILPTISIAGAQIPEGNSGVTNVSVTITLSDAITQPVRVSFATVPGSSSEGPDYEKASGVIEFAPGEQTKSIELHILGDVFPEDDETFSVVLSDPFNATIDTASAMVVIDNDDAGPPKRRAARH
jgi:hypothetical protein